jgi:hypothetical protein
MVSVIYGKYRKDRSKIISEGFGSVWNISEGWKGPEGDAPRRHHGLHQGHHIRRRGESKVEAWRWRKELRLLQR